MGQWIFEGWTLRFGGGKVGLGLGMGMDWRRVRRWGWECIGLSLRARVTGDQGVVVVEVGDEEDGIRDGWGLSWRLRLIGDRGGWNLA